MGSITLLQGLVKPAIRTASSFPFHLFFHPAATQSSGGWLAPQPPVGLGSASPAACGMGVRHAPAPHGDPEHVCSRVPPACSLPCCWHRCMGSGCTSGSLSLLQHGSNRTSSSHQHVQHLLFFSTSGTSHVSPCRQEPLQEQNGLLVRLRLMKSYSPSHPVTVLLFPEPRETWSLFLQVPMKSQKCWGCGGRKGCLSHLFTASHGGGFKPTVPSMCNSLPTATGWVLPNGCAMGRLRWVPHGVRSPFLMG